MSHKRHRQKELRRKGDELAFLFDPTMTKCLAEVKRDDWEWAIAMSGGSVSDTAAMAGINEIPRNTRAIWGKSQAHALDSYHQWIRRKEKRR